MSTGDQSQYIRAKMAERGSNAQSKFMMDGFDRWAESTAPAREGQMEKIAAEPTGSSCGGAMTLSKAKRKLHKLEGVHELEGGVDVMGTINTAIDYARKVREFWDKASKFIDELEKDLNEEILANSVYNKDKGLVDTVNGFLQIMQGFKLYKTQIDAFSAGLKAIGLGKPHGGKLHGGADVTQLGKIAGQIIQWVKWLHTAAKNLRTILKLPSLHPVGGKVIEVLEPVLKLIGASRKRSSSPCMEYCQCDEMDGGARLKISNEFKSPLENMIARKVGKYRAEKPGPTDKYLASLPMGRHEAGREIQRAEEDAMLAYIEKARAVRMAKSAGMPAAAAYLSASGRKRGNAAPMAYELFDEDLRPFYDEDLRPFTEEERSYMDIRSIGGRKKAMHMMPDGSMMPGATHGGAMLAAQLLPLGMDLRHSRDAVQHLARAAQLAAMRGGPSEPVGLGGRAAPSLSRTLQAYNADGMTEMEMKKKAMGGRKRSARKVMVMEPMLGGAFQSCKPGWIDDGLLCRKPINCSGFPLKCEGGEVVPKKRVGGKKPSARGAIVKKVMREQGLSLPQASKYVKDNGLY